MKPLVRHAVVVAVAAACLAACGSESAPVETTSAEPSATSTAPSTATPTVAPDPAGAIPAGISASFARWNVSLSPTTRNATESILGAQPAHETPANGSQFVTVVVAATYTGEGTGTPTSDLTFAFVGSDGLAYAVGADSQCGTLPDDLTTFTDIAAGGAATGTICSVVPSAVVDGGTWLVSTTENGQKLTYGLEAAG